MKKAITLLLLIIGLSCQGKSAVSTAPIIHMAHVPASTKAILEAPMPKVLIKASSLSEVARYFRRESRKVDPNHIGLNVIALTPKDFGLNTKNTVGQISFIARDTSFIYALTIAAQLFNMKVEIRKDIYILPVYCHFEDWTRKSGS